MLIDSDNVIPITRLQKELTKKIRELSATGEPVYILKNNTMEAVLVSFDEYKRLVNLEEMFEYFEIDETVKKRMSSYDAKENVGWESLRQEP
ncbi:MAG: type II toxin-antitoxin system Phd/YefM family antitoxin [Rectinemataceae bacterium]